MEISSFDTLYKGHRSPHNRRCALHMNTQIYIYIYSLLTLSEVWTFPVISIIKLYEWVQRDHMDNASYTQSYTNNFSLYLLSIHKYELNEYIRDLSSDDTYVSFLPTMITYQRSHWFIDFIDWVIHAVQANNFPNQVIFIDHFDIQASTVEISLCMYVYAWIINA